MDYSWAVARRKNQVFPAEPRPQCLKPRSADLLLVTSSCGVYHWSCFISARCWWQGDNTVKELRNSFTGKMCSLMTSASYFNAVSHHHLMVGHTHEDVGALDQNYVVLFHASIILECECAKTLQICNCAADGAMALVTSALASESNIQTPRDVIRTSYYLINLIYWSTLECHKLLSNLIIAGSWRKRLLQFLRSMTWSSVAKWLTQCHVKLYVSCVFSSCDLPSSWI